MNEEMKPYGVSYIASAPEDLRVGDKVKIRKNTQSRHEGEIGTITLILDNGLYKVGFGGYSDDYPWQCLRKLPDIISFEEDSDNIKTLKVGDRVEVCDFRDDLYGQKAVVENIVDDYVTIKFSDGKSYEYYENQLVKLPDIDNPLDTQVGGSHYSMPIQPIEFIERNGLGFSVGNCIKYLCRYKQKNGKEDLLKARHYIDLLIQLEYPEDK